MPARDAVPLPRLRAGCVGVVGAGTGVLAHTQGHGGLPGVGGLLIVAVAGLGLGLAARHTARLLPLLAGGQLLVHLLLIALTGQHHQLITAPMALVHGLGTLAAWALVLGAEQLVRTVAGLALRVLVLVGSTPIEQPSGVLVPAFAVPQCQRLRHLGTVGTRGPPVLSNSF
ncbi:hypothetical protein GOHSU_35_00180 [Gordonia hirsuta DSM 44140 = NBRC 16056]|uniref:Uncharacterized protein n=1 Tax=Gordonia hirsuta DSM 44140 = NBRC 16056 TaxID=1121927 RepID=L7LDU9_9ACTN|nr:hypothetical protein [Gordonia hirsuta]GAC58223.1 hypothetical protein GOHSU_35_00180 [Gordonia hirsuta DSM 44140 = NBRC 16056]